MDEANTENKKTPDYPQGRSVPTRNGTSRLDKHLSGSSHSHGRSSSQFVPQNKINTASRTSGIADPYDLSTENEVLNLGRESERRISRREERARVADPEMTFRPEQYEVSATCPPFLRGKKGTAILVFSLLAVVGIIVGTILGTKKASRPKNPVASPTTSASEMSAAPTAVIADTETLTIEDIITSSILPATVTG